MGCQPSAARTSDVEKNKPEHLVQKENSKRWKVQPTIQEAREKYEADGTVAKGSDADHVQLRLLLEEPVGQNYIGAYARELKSQELFMFWIDVQEFKNIPTDNYRRSKGLHIYNKYIKTGAVLQLGYIESTDDEFYASEFAKSKLEPSIITKDFFTKLQSKCFQEMYSNVYSRFKSSPKFDEMQSEIKKTYNKVGMEDFDIFEKIGEGGFGLVVHCRKKSTGRHYAIKIQTKKALLECFADDPSRVTYESSAFVKCQHPFIINMDYAFQTETLACMVLGLATAGDLDRALAHSPDRRLSEERVKFYTAEIVLALSHLHGLGLMYRDMKPSNILLNYDGHVQLADLGGVINSKGKNILGGGEYIPFFSPTVEEAPTEPSGKRMSIMGTFGYMAPEIVALMNQNPNEVGGYSKTVDWWSLGCTVYKMLTGSKPFDVEHAITEFFEMQTSFFTEDKSAYTDEYMKLFQGVEIPPYVSAEAGDLVTSFLNVLEPYRLGSGPNGIKNIKSHPFFAQIDWDKLEQKHHIPPFIPKVGRLKERALYQTCDSMLESYRKKEWLDGKISLEDQKHFQSWDYICPSTVKMEFGIANEMDQYDSNFKIRQLLG